MRAWPSINSRIPLPASTQAPVRTHSAIKKALPGQQQHAWRTQVVRTANPITPGWDAGHEETHTEFGGGDFRGREIAGVNYLGRVLVSMFTNLDENEVRSDQFR